MTGGGAFTSSTFYNGTITLKTKSPNANVTLLTAASLLPPFFFFGMMIYGLLEMSILSETARSFRFRSLLHHLIII